MRQPSAFAHLGMRTYASTSASTMTSLYLCSFIDLGVKRWVIISMMLTCDASVVVGYDRTRPRLCNAPINIQEI